jgi:hypothetical protein
MQCLEEERISQMQDFLNRYNTHLSAMGPKMIRGCEKLRDAVISVDCNSDLRRAVDHKGTGPNQPEQLLPEIYAEDLRNSMDDTRRKQALTNFLIAIQADLEKELKGKEGVEKLAEVYQNKPNYGDADAQADTWQRLAQVNASINYLEAAKYKVECCLAEIEGREKPQFQHSSYIERNRDKTGYNVSILRVPLSMTVDPNCVGTRPPADGGHVDSVYASQVETQRQNSTVSRQSSRLSTLSRASSALSRHNSTLSTHDDDEFDTFDGAGSPPISMATAIYDYVGQHCDELTIRPGDVIQVLHKQDDGWWKGELNGNVGIFPATYVQEA